MFEYQQRELAVLHEQVSIMQYLIDKMRVGLDCLDQDVTSDGLIDGVSDEWMAGYLAGVGDAKPIAKENDMPKLCTCDECWDVKDPYEHRMD
jgi:hypothetical protein